nr:SprT family zinc-dependent metalloprotease [uncultured Helicobacter sp.]
MIKALQNSYPNAKSIHIESKAIAYPRIVIKADLSLYVRVPKAFSQEQILAFINTHKSWIHTTLAKLQAHKQDIDIFLQSHTGQILVFGEWLEYDKILPQAHLQSLQPSLKNTLHTLLLEYITQSCAFYAAKMELVYKDIKITNALSRFGSCTFDNRLRFSFMLIFADKKLIDYVIIHELSHIVHKNHSQSFWNLVERFCPNAKAHRKALRKQARFYPALIQRLSL